MILHHKWSCLGVRSKPRNLTEAIEQDYSNRKSVNGSKVAGLLKGATMAGSLAAVIAAGSSSPALAAQSRGGLAGTRPNIVFIMSDDQLSGDLGCYGSKSGMTPNIDALANGGARFTRACGVTSVCGPARVNFLTGRYLSRCTPCPTNPLARQTTNPVTLGHRLQKIGYHTGFVGKIHFANQGIKGIPMKDVAKRMLKMGFDSVPQAHYCRFKVGDHIKYQTKDFDAAIEFVKKTKASKKPFVLLLFTTLVHGPAEALPKFIKMASRKGMSKSAIVGKAMTLWLDSEVGRLVGTVDKAGIRKNTIIFYAGDHAPSFWGGNRGRRYPGDRNKGTVYDGWQPLIANWPGRIRAGTVINQVVQNIDYLPTMMELAGKKVLAAPKVDGRSLVPLLEGRKTNWPQTRFFEYGPERAVRTENFKYIALRKVPGMYKWQVYTRNYGGKKDLLFDLKKDPCEKNNLFGNPKYASVVRDLQAKLKAHCSKLPFKFGEFGGGK
jgi:arylsulfatase A